MRKKEICPIEEEMRIFNEEFPDEDSCIKALVAIAGATAGTCTCCLQCEYIKTDDARFYECPYCGDVYRILQDTIFARVLLFREWFAAFWLASRRVKLSGHRFWLQFRHIAPSTAYRIVKSVAWFLKSKMSDLPEGFTTSLLNLFCRRSSQTPANEHPRSEQTLLDELCSNAECPEYDNSGLREDGELNEVFANELTAEELTVIGFFSSAEAQSVDEIFEKTDKEYSDLLATIMELHFKGLLETDNGNTFWLKKKKTVSACSELIRKGLSIFGAEAKLFWKGIGRKNVQLYIALHWNSLVSTNWEADLWRDLLAFEMPTWATLQNYVSPAKVMIPVVENLSD